MSSRLVTLAAAPVLALALAATTAPAASAAPALQVGALTAAPSLVDLQAEVDAVSAALTDATRRLEEGEARLAEVRAQGVQARAEADAAVAVTEAARVRLGRIVGAAYRSPQPSDVAVALSAGRGELGDAVRAQVSLEQVQGSQQDTLREAMDEAMRAEALVREAERLEKEADEQAAALAAELADVQAKAEQSRTRLEAAAAQLEQDRIAREATRASRDRTVPPPVVGGGSGSCGGGSLGGYGNGLIPSNALCPLDGTNGLLLRADAAAAFNRMAAAGGMPCAGNSYRSYAQQVAVYRVKPNLAAVPGTSNHGWGVAVDFACGAESFGSPGYNWLKKNGPSYGWNHPSWAEPGGSRPEPWHWEYTG